MIVNKNASELAVGDSVIYVHRTERKVFAIRGEIVDIVPMTTLLMKDRSKVDIRVDFVGKNPANGKQIVRVWSDDVRVYDAERTVFV